MLYVGLSKNVLQKTIIMQPAQKKLNEQCKNMNNAWTKRTKSGAQPSGGIAPNYTPDNQTK